MDTITLEHSEDGVSLIISLPKEYSVANFSLMKESSSETRIVVTFRQTTSGLSPKAKEVFVAVLHRLKHASVSYRQSYPSSKPKLVLESNIKSWRLDSYKTEYIRALTQLYGG